MSRETTVTKLPKEKRKSLKEVATILLDPTSMNNSTEIAISNGNLPLKTKKSKHSNAALEDAALELDQSGEEPLKNPKKKKQKHAEEDAAIHVEGAGDADAEGKKKRKRDKVENEGDADAAKEFNGSEKKKKKKLKQDNETVQQEAARKDIAEDVSEIEKKRKHRKIKDAVGQEVQEVPKAKSKKQKRKHIDIGLPNPEKDSSLADQARKGIYTLFFNCHTI